MRKKVFKISVFLLATVFTIFFIVVVFPPFIQNPNIISALGAGFVNPYSSGYSADVIVCWFILAAWIIYESNFFTHGWICLLLGLFPGVAVGFAAYLIFRLPSEKTKHE